MSELPHYLLAVIYPKLERFTREDFQRITLEFLKDLAINPKSEWLGEPGKELMMLVDPVLIQSERRDDAIDFLLEIANSAHFKAHSKPDLRLKALQGLVMLRHRVSIKFWQQHFERGGSLYAPVVLEGLALIDVSAPFVWLKEVEWNEVVKDAVINLLPSLLEDYGTAKLARVIEDLLPELSDDASTTLLAFFDEEGITITLIERPDKKYDDRELQGAATPTESSINGVKPAFMELFTDETGKKGESNIISGRMQILWVKNELLHAIDNESKIRTFQMLKHLKHDHHITYLTMDNGTAAPDAVDRAEEYCHKLIRINRGEPRKYSIRFYWNLIINLNSQLPYVIEKYRSSAMQSIIRRELSARAYDVIVYDHLGSSINAVENLKTASVLLQHNVESMLWRRLYERQTNRTQKAYLYHQWRKMYRYEQKALSMFDAVIAVSASDRSLMQDEFGLERVYDVPSGVDTEYFQPLGGERDPHQIIFTGALDWIPNEDAVVYFAEKILPLVARSVPDVVLYVVGSNPTRRLMRLTELNKRIRVTGHVEDIRPYVDRASCCVLPIRIAVGRLTTLEMMAMEKAIISTTIGVEGLPVQNGKQIIIADSEEEFAQAVIRVLSDRILSDQLGRQARTFARSNSGWDPAARVFAQVCERLIDMHRSNPVIKTA